MVTGGAGQVGTELAPRLRRSGHEVVALDRGGLDITDRAAVAEAVGAAQPAVVVNCAAYNAVDAAETDRDAAMAVNRDGPAHLAEAAAATGSHLVHLSTDYVFSGDATEPYVEDDRPDPRSVYGRSKLAGEEAVAERTDAWTVVRTAWVFGSIGRSLVETVIRLAAGGEALRMVDDQRGSPTHAGDLAGVVVALATAKLGGLFHVTNAGSCTPYELACDVLERAGLTRTPIERITTEQLGRPAPRPAFSVLASTRLANTGITPLRHYREALDELVPHLVAGASGRSWSSAESKGQ